ncbi:tetratricopeptide repeat protein [Sulfobacillus thermosulfidooxidans]|uniref:tetratricopeptide repeat protein n=1 Tax=Sulfobacillus thermosulfidooxidans TaxID=28034 RepID=UPI0002DD75F6|nr:tetratricopeptide repeat protein [Sulfobacillus thermosulfidooxidans]
MDENQWTVIVNTWAYDETQIEETSAPFIGWANRIVFVELGPWHRQLDDSLWPPGIEIQRDWPGSFRLQYDQILRKEQDLDTDMILFLDGNEIIRRMDLHDLNHYTSRHVAAYRLPVLRSGGDESKKELRILRLSRWHGFHGVYKADPYPELTAFSEPILEGEISILRTGDSVKPVSKLEGIIREAKDMDLLVRARWLLDTREFSAALRLLKKEGTKSLFSNEKSLDVRTMMAEALMGLKKPHDALQMLAPLIARFPNADRAYLMGHALYALDRFEEASTYFFQAGTGAYGLRESQEPGADGYRALLWAAKSLHLANRPKDSFVMVTRLLEDFPFFHEGWKFFFALLGDAKPEKLYELVTQIVSPQTVREVFERIGQTEGPEQAFQQWLFR